jgi:hypothetical protein
LNRFLNSGQLSAVSFQPELLDPVVKAEAWLFAQACRTFASLASSAFVFALKPEPFLRLERLI